MADGFYFDNYRIITDPNNFILQERKINANSKDKSKIGTERWENVGFYPNLELAFNKLANRLVNLNIDNLSLAIKKIEELKTMIKNITEIKL